jgi:hypothetical protein
LGVKVVVVSGRGGFQAQPGIGLAAPPHGSHTVAGLVVVDGQADLRMTKMKVEEEKVAPLRNCL